MLPLQHKNNRKMSKKIIYSAIAIAVLIEIVIISILIGTMRNNKIAKINYEALKKDNALQQELTRSELKKYYENELNTLKDLGVKNRQVERIVETSYNYVDSTIYHDSLIFVFDTIVESPLARFEIDAKCNTISGYVVDNILTVDNIENHDTLLMCLYKQKKKCIFERRKYRALVYSGCTGDTMQVFTNIFVK